MKTYIDINGLPVWGSPLQNAVDQMANCLRVGGAVRGALAADHHLGYAVPIGGSIAYRDAVSPSAVGFDIACGNKAVRLPMLIDDIREDIPRIMDDVWKLFSFGMGRKNADPVDHPLFHDDPAWEIPVAAAIRDMSRGQLGTIGSGNHFITIQYDELGRVWVANHFGSRGLGHKLASHFIKAGGGKDGINVDPVVLDVNTQLGQEYVACMQLAGRYAYAGRDWVCDSMAELICGSKEAIQESIHNHHNFAWLENHGGENLWVVRKGATPAFPGQRGFVGASMGEPSVIIEGIDSEEARLGLYSAPHGAGRAMSRTQAAGKVKWIKGQKTRVTQGLVSEQDMRDWVMRAGVELRGAGVDESPHCYKRLTDVLASHSNTLRIAHTLTPVGVAMAGEDDVDPYKD
jgi:tRNA-splicing ligase RtcB